MRLVILVNLIVFIVMIESKTIADLYNNFDKDPNDDPFEISTSTTTTTTTTSPTTITNEISSASISCDESGRCGCYKGNCWSYIDEKQMPSTGWWCFTQQEGVRGKQKAWAKCTDGTQCTWAMTCGNCFTYVGQRKGIKTDKILC